MKLSEAIRLGAMLKPQGFGRATTGPRATATCALGAAYQASGSQHSWGSLCQHFPILSRLEWVECPECRVPHETPIPHLNDDHRWTREQIADWLETIEAQYDTPSQPQPVPVEAK